MKRSSQTAPAPSRARGRIQREPSTVDIDEGRSTTGMSHLALTVRSSTTVGRQYGSGHGERVVLPYNIFEFGFPKKDYGNQLPVRPQFTDEGGTKFMESSAGQRLRQLEKKYSAVMRQYIMRSVRLTGASVLILGSGSSKNMIPLLRRLPASVTFVDVSQPALDTLRRNLEEIGILASVDATFVCQDAWEFLPLAPKHHYDLVVATKCLGLVYSADPVARTPSALFDALEDILADDGSVVVDHHVAFIQDHGQLVSEVVQPELYALATIGGRYAQDVTYTSDVSHHAYDKVSCLSFDSVGHGVQEWEAFHYRVKPPQPPSVVQARTYGAPLAPVPFDYPPLLTFDVAADARMPINAKGVKRAPTMSDRNMHRVDRAMPKFDGQPGVIAVGGTLAVFMGSRYRFVRELAVDVSPRVELVGELVGTGDGRAVCVVTGVLSVGDARADPLSLAALDQVRALVGAMSCAGFMCSSPDLLRGVSNDRIFLNSKQSGAMYLKVDGIHVELSGRNGVFLKTADSNTIDAVGSEAVSLITEASRILRLPAPSVAVPAESVDDVWEFTRPGKANAWRPLRVRNDKQLSDKLGAIVATINASFKAQEVGFTNDVKQIAKNALR